ncbi:hypothetical protein CR513_33452, partial [Mucuna pruriens]
MITCSKLLEYSSLSLAVGTNSDGRDELSRRRWIRHAKSPCRVKLADGNKDDFWYPMAKGTWSRLVKRDLVLAGMGEKTRSRLVEWGLGLDKRDKFEKRNYELSSQNSIFSLGKDGANNQPFIDHMPFDFDIWVNTIGKKKGRTSERGFVERTLIMSLSQSSRSSTSLRDVDVLRRQIQILNQSLQRQETWLTGHDPLGSLVRNGVFPWRGIIPMIAWLHVNNFVTLYLGLV